MKPTKEQYNEYLEDVEIYKEKMNIIVDKVNQIVKEVTLDVKPTVVSMIDQQTAAFFIALSLANAPSHIRAKLLDHIIKDAKKLVRSIQPAINRSAH